MSCARPGCIQCNLQILFAHLRAPCGCTTIEEAQGHIKRQYEYARNCTAKKDKKRKKRKNEKDAARVAALANGAVERDTNLAQYGGCAYTAYLDTLTPEERQQDGADLGY